MARRFVAPARPAKKIDYKTWFLLPGLSVTHVGNQTFQGGALTFSDAATILRIRGHIQLSFDDLVVVGDRINMVVGVGIVSTDAFSAGAGSMPDPATDFSYPWLWLNEIQLINNNLVDDGAFGLTAQRIEIDSKAMRKITGGQSLVMIGELTGDVGAPNNDIEFGRLRVLVGT